MQIVFVLSLADSFLKCAPQPKGYKITKAPLFLGFKVVQGDQC